MKKQTINNTERKILHEKLIKQNQNALAKLIASLDDKQYKLLARYIRTSDKLHHHEIMNIALLLKTNKKG